MTGWTIGIIGGSGLYAIDALEDVETLVIDTPWGAPSDTVMRGHIGDVRFVFLPRHGRGHRLSPTEVNARANIHALKMAGCTDVLAISAIGSLREELSPGHFVAVDQFIDRTVHRDTSFFGSGLVAHVSMADPVCARLSTLAAQAGERAGARMVHGGTYLAMEGPQFSTRAESRLYRQWGADVIGMTAMPEAKLAREAELPYALIGMVTDYDSWRDDVAHVEVDAVLAQLVANAATARALVVALAALLPARRTPSPIDTVLDQALITHISHVDRAKAETLGPIVSRVLAARGG